MKFATATSTNTDLRAACVEAATSAKKTLGDRSIDLCLVFVTQGFCAEDLAIDLTETAGFVIAAIEPGMTIGCTGAGVIDNGLELENDPAVTVTLASLPGVQVVTKHVFDESLPGPDAPPSAWHELLGLSSAQARGFLVLPEPDNFDTETLLSGLDYAYPDVPKIGGMSAGSPLIDHNYLFIEKRVERRGAIIIGFAGPIEIESIVTQGCRSFGRVGRVTRSDGNEIQAIDGMNAHQFLQEQIARLSSLEEGNIKRSPMFVGIAMDPFALSAPGPGDYLIRNMLGFNREQGVIRVEQHVPVGRAIQFHYRDLETSKADLRRVLKLHNHGEKPAAAILFQCTGRGSRLYDELGHDSREFLASFGDVSLSGFFGEGEIGPVGSTTHIHSYTSAFALFRETTIDTPSS